MTFNDDEALGAILGSYGYDRTRLLDVLLAVQRRLGHVDDRTIDAIAARLAMPAGRRRRGGLLLFLPLRPAARAGS